MNPNFNCPHCQTNYPIVCGSGMPLIYLTSETYSSMNIECKVLHKEFADAGRAYFYGPHWKFHHRKNGWKINNIWGEE